MKLSSVLRLLLIIFRRRSKRVGLVLSCVWFSTKLACSENGDSSSWESAAVLCCRIGFLPKRSPHAVHDYGSYRARHSLLNASSIVFLMLTLPPHPADRACIAVCVVFKPSWWMWKLIRSLWSFGGFWVEYVAAFFRGRLSRRSRLRKLSPLSRLNTCSIVLALLMPPPFQAGRDIVLLCVWCSRQLGVLKASLVRVSPRALASLLRLATCYQASVFVFFRTAHKSGENK